MFYFNKKQDDLFCCCFMAALSFSYEHQCPDEPMMLTFWKYHGAAFVRADSNELFNSHTFTFGLLTHSLSSQMITG